jgi:minor extracellular serine protease Vpr
MLPTSRSISGTLLLLGALALPAATHAQQSPAPQVGQLLVPAGGASTDSRISPLLARAKGRVNVWVQLQTSPLAVEQANAKDSGLPLTRGAQRAHLARLDDEHDSLSRTAFSLGARELGRVSKAYNAVAYSIDAGSLPALAAQPGVLTVRPVINYSIDLSETVPYIGAAAVQNTGVTGKGVRVAVLDSGVDYTHRNLSGSGSAADYTAAFGTSLDDSRNRTINPALFPSGKVIGGFDFVGEHWPQPDAAHCGTDPATGAALSCLLPDPNPIGCGGVGGCDGTHGTHVADIIAGKSKDGTHKGVAPGAQLYALKVCSSVSTSCSGVALMQAMEFALDPDGDGDLSNAVDVVNMSLGSNYGQFEDDLTAASENAVRLGVVVACAAGNAADHPYIVSSPSIAPGAISVAQTQVPSAKFYPLVVNSPASIAGRYNNTATVDWAPIGAGFTGDVAFVGRGCPAGSISATNPDDPYVASPAGKVALIDRGACAVSLKVDRAIAAGAIGVLIGLVAPGDAVSFSFGGGTHMGPTLVIIQSYATFIKTALGPTQANAVNVTVHDSSPLVKSLATTSARGPSYSYQTIKPEIGAPGASVSAIAGTGTGEAAFGGTSGATPMIAGSAALILEAFPHASPAEVKARLMNNTETQIFTAQNLFGAQLAPATRIGAGEVRVDRAINAKTIAFVPEDETAGISFGAPYVSETREFRKTVLVHNTSKSRRRYAVSADFRDPANPATAAVSFSLPSSVEVGSRGFGYIEMRIRVDPSKLSTWTLNGGLQGGNGPLQTSLELDGHLTIRDSIDTVKLPWSVLPHKAADVRAEDDVELRSGTGSLRLSNEGTLAGRTDVFAWTGTSKKIPSRFLPKPGDNFAVIDLGQVGVRQALAGTTPVVQFAINTFGKRAHPNYPAEFDIYIDANRDGTPEFVIFNLENGGFGATGQNRVAVANLATGASSLVAFADADLNSSNMIFTVPLSAVGLTTSSQFDFSVFAFDNYFTGNLTDSIENMTFSFAAPRFTASGVPEAGVPARGRATLTVTENPKGATASPSQAGLLLMYRDAARQEAQAVRVGREDDRN